MKSTGNHRWREVCVLAGVPGSVLLSWLAGHLEFDFSGAARQPWVLNWGVGAFYALTVLCPLAWCRSLSWRWLLPNIVLSVFAWHWAVQIASEGYDDGSPASLRFLLRSTFSGFFGAVLVAVVPLARSRQPHWERFLGIIGLVGGVCGLQMGGLCLWNFGLGYWLGMAGWQLAVTVLLLYGTAPQRAGNSAFWPAPPQLR